MVEAKHSPEKLVQIYQTVPFRIYQTTSLQSQMTVTVSYPCGNFQFFYLVMIMAGAKVYEIGSVSWICGSQSYGRWCVWQAQEDEHQT
jgi:hypothetical protein